jgi:hypothetical protein
MINRRSFLTDLAGIDFRNPDEPLVASADLAPEAEDIPSYAVA